MAIQPPPLINATPGDPITSEAWNNIIASIKALYEVHNQSASRLEITVTNDKDGSVIKKALVTLVPEKGPPVTAGFAGAKTQKYLVNVIKPGSYKLFVEAPDYADEIREILIPEKGEAVKITIEMTKTANRKKVGNYFGESLSAAKNVIDEAGFLLNRIIDSHGEELSLADIKDQGAKVKVLNQVPAPGEEHRAGGPVALLVSSVPVAAQRVKVPDLQGLTFNEARVALEDLDLILGETQITSSK